MAVVPTVFRDWWEDFERPSRLLDQHFGLSLTPEDLVKVLPMPPLTYPFRNYLRPWCDLLEQNSTIAKGKNDKNQFEVLLDVQQFAPDEMTVKTVDNFIIVEGKHEEKKDEHGYVTRQFVRRYTLPEGHDISNVVSSLSSNGVLTISAPKLSLSAPHERIVPIQKTIAPAVKQL